MEGEVLAHPALSAFRRDHYAVLARLLAREPSAPLLDALREDMAEQVADAAAVDPVLGEAWHALARALEGVTEEAAGAAFTAVFLHPVRPAVQPYESYYLAGALFERPLADVRRFLRRIGLERDPQRFAEPEDALAFELETMRYLTAQQTEQTGNAEAWLQLQAEFLAQHLLVWAPACAADLRQARGHGPYGAVADVLTAFLAFERELFQSHGRIVVDSLDAARRRYTQESRDVPVFDPAAANDPGG